MNDTPRHILEKQFEIVFSMPLNERLNSVVELTDLSRSIIYNQLAKKFPNHTDIELKVELFKAFYRNDFDHKTIEIIAQSMKNYLVLEKNKESNPSF